MKKIVVLLFLTGASSAWGQLFEAWFNGGESLLGSRNLGSTVPTNGFIDPNSGLQYIGPSGQASDYSLGDGFRFSFRIAFNNDSHFGHEVQYAYNRSSLTTQGAPLLLQGLSSTPEKQGMAIHMGGYNFLYYATPEGTRIRPFATGGVLFANYVPPGSSASGGGGSTKFGLSYGVGVKVKVTQLFGLRFDVRQATTPKPDFGGSLIYERSGWIKLNEISAGIGVGF